MGTSGIYNGPKGNNPLLPEWYQEEQKENVGSQIPYYSLWKYSF